MNKFIREFRSLSRDSKLYKGKDLKNLNTFKLKCKTRVYVEVGSFSDLTILFSLIRRYKLNSFCLGGGSKVLLPKKFDGVIYSLTGKFSSIERVGDFLIVGGGTRMSALCDYCAKNDLSCVEWGLGIPCSIGGGVYMNAGCFGKCFGDIVSRVIYTDGKGLYSIDNEACEFSYRHSFFKDKSFIILYAILKVAPSINIKSKTLEYFTKKTTSQPYNYPSVGSIFKAGTLAAPLYIESIGLKGYRCGGAEVSDKHCGFIINKKNATQKQVLKIISKIKKTVWKKDAILLYDEVIVLGGKNGIFR